MEESMKKRIFLAAALSFGLLLSGCSNTSKTTNNSNNSSETTVATSTTVASTTTENPSAANTELDTKSVAGTTGNFYGWGGDDKLNAWLDDYFAPRMKEKYNVTLKRVPMDIDQILSQLSGEIQAGEKEGDIDMIWINGENFKTAKDNQMLYGPFTDKLPNFNRYVDANADNIKYDFAYPVDGYEAPYGKAQFVFEADTATVPASEFPTDLDKLEEFVKAHPGKFTYPALPDFTGSAFVRNVIAITVGNDIFKGLKPTKIDVKIEITPAIDYLKSLNPYLWNQGKTFPASSTELENMFADGEVLINMTYGAYSVAANIESGKFPETVQSFQFDKGTLGNTNYIAIAKNSKNKEGAMVAINEMLDPEVQANRYAKLKTIPVLDNAKLSSEQKAAFDQVDLGKGTIPQQELASKFIPEIPAEFVPIIEEIWNEEVVGK